MYARRMRALSIRQPWAELILRGKKRIEVRKRRTKIRGVVFVYASATVAERELEGCARYRIKMQRLKKGVLVGKVEIVDCRPLRKSDARAACLTRVRPKLWAWILKRPKRAKRTRAPKRQPQPVFFNPF